MVPDYWWSFIYLYSVGGVIFVLGLVLILKTKSCMLSKRSDRFWFGVLLGGFFWYFGIHLLWYLAAINIMPNPGGGVG